MRAVTLFFWNLKPTQSIHRFALPFLTYMVDLTFGKIFNILEESQQINYLGIYIYNSSAKGFISANAQVDTL